MRTRQPIAQTKANGLKRTRIRIQQKAELEQWLKESRANYAANTRAQIAFLKKKLDEFRDIVVSFCDAVPKKSK